MRKTLISNPYLRVFLFCLALVGVHFLLILPLWFLAGALSDLPGGGPFGLFRSHQNIIFTLTAFAGAIIVVIVFVFWVFIDGRKISTLRLSLSRKALLLFAKGTVFAGVLVAGFFGFAIVLGGLEVQGFRSAGIPADLISWALFYALILFVSAAAEETVFRGYIFRNLAERERPLLAVALSSLLFSLVHIANPYFSEFAIPAGINIFLVGTLLCLLYLKDLSLWVAVGFHFAWNFLLGFILSFPVSGMEMKGLLEVRTLPARNLLLGGSFGPEGGWLMTVFLAGALFLLAVRFREHRSPSRRN